MIEIKNFTASKKAKRKTDVIFQNVSFQMEEKGVALLKGNSASAFVESLSGKYDAFSGSIKIGDETSFFRNGRQYEDFARNHIFFFDLDEFFFEGKTIFDNLRIILKIKRKQARESIQAILHGIGMHGKEKIKIKEFSLAERLSLAFECIRKKTIDILVCPCIFQNRSDDEKKTIRSFFKEFSKQHLVILTGCEESDIPFLSQSIDLDNLVNSQSINMSAPCDCKEMTFKKESKSPLDVLLKEGMTCVSKKKAIAPLLLSAVTFSLLGLSFSMFSVSRSDGFAKSLSNSEYDTIQIQKSEQVVLPVRYNPRPSYEYQSLFDVGMNIDDISYLEQEAGLKMYGVMSGDLKFQHPLYSRYDDYSSVLFDIRTDCLPYQDDTSYDIDVSYGKPPEKENEILISDIMAESLVSCGFYDPYDKKIFLPEEKDISSLPGRHIEFHNRPTEISGIYQSGIRFSDYASLKKTSYDDQHNESMTEKFREEVSSHSSLAFFSNEYYENYGRYQGYYSLDASYESVNLVTDNGYETKISDFGSLSSEDDIFVVRDDDGVILSNPLAASYFDKACKTNHVDTPVIEITLDDEDSVHSDFVGRNIYYYGLEDISSSTFMKDVAPLCFYRAVWNHFDDALLLDSELSKLTYASHPLSEYKTKYIEGDSKERSKDIICYTLTKHILDSYQSEDYRFYPEYVKEATNLLNSYGNKYQPVLCRKQKEAYERLFSRYPDGSVYIDGNRYPIRGVCLDNDREAIYLKSDEIRQYVKNIYAKAICRNPKSASRLKKLTNLHCRFKNMDESFTKNPVGTYYQIQGRDMDVYNSVLRVSLWMRYIVLLLSIIFFVICCIAFSGRIGKSIHDFRNDLHLLRLHGYQRKDVDVILLFHTFLLSLAYGILGYGIYMFVSWILNVFLSHVLYASVSFFLPSLWLLLLIPVLWFFLFLRYRHESIKVVYRG